MFKNSREKKLNVEILSYKGFKKKKKMKMLCIFFIIHTHVHIHTNVYEFVDNICSHAEKQI